MVTESENKGIGEYIYYVNQYISKSFLLMLIVNEIIRIHSEYWI